MDNEEKDIIEEFPEDEDSSNNDDTDELLKRYENRSRRRTDNVPAMQTAMCILLAAGIFALNKFYPETGKDILDTIKMLSADNSDTMKNPLEWLFSIIR